MTELKDLQAIIDKRASDRLRADIRALVNPIQNSKLLENLQVFLPSSKNPEKFEVVYFKNALYYDYMLGKKLFDDNIERYKAEEAANFVKKVDEIKDQVDDLYEITSNLENR